MRCRVPRCEQYAGSPVSMCRACFWRMSQAFREAIAPAIKSEDDSRYLSHDELLDPESEYQTILSIGADWLEEYDPL